MAVCEAAAAVLGRPVEDVVWVVEIVDDVAIFRDDDDDDDVAILRDDDDDDDGLAVVV